MGRKCRSGLRGISGGLLGVREFNLLVLFWWISLAWGLMGWDRVGLVKVRSRRCLCWIVGVWIEG